MLPDLSSDYAITKDQIDSFRRDGFILLRSVLTEAEMSVYRQAVLGLVEAEFRATKPIADRDAYGKSFVQIMHLWERSADVARLSLCKRIGGIVAQLFGVARIRIYHDQVLIKEPGGSSTAWHQDQYYVPLDTDNVLTMWMPMVPATPDMGTLKFAARSHTSGMLFNETIGERTETYFDDLITRQEMQTVQIGEMRPGDATFHFGWTIHAAPANTTDRIREVFNALYFADPAHIVARGPWEDASRGHMKGLKFGQRVETDINVIVYP